MCIMVIGLILICSLLSRLSLIFQVAAVVFTEDLKRLYVTMKEGFPLEYIVSIKSLSYAAKSVCFTFSYRFLLIIFSG